jgi:hypothetical protein
MNKCASNRTIKFGKNNVGIRVITLGSCNLSMILVQDDLIRTRATIETNAGRNPFVDHDELDMCLSHIFLFHLEVKRTILDRNLSERTAMSQS